MTAVIFLILRIGLAAALYAFLWVVFRALLRDLNQQGILLTNRKKPVLYIVVKPENGAVKTYHFQQDEIKIGRSPNSSITLSDEALSVNHARITFHHTQWWLEDLGSRNGTYLSNNPVSVPTVVIDGDEFKCGNTHFILQIDSTKESRGQNG